MHEVSSPHSTSDQSTASFLTHAHETSDAGTVALRAEVRKQFHDESTLPTLQPSTAAQGFQFPITKICYFTQHEGPSQTGELIPPFSSVFVTTVTTESSYSTCDKLGTQTFWLSLHRPSESVDADDTASLHPPCLQIPILQHDNKYK